MLGELSCRQLDEWLAFYTLEPWGNPWHHTAAVMWASLTPWSKQRLTPSDFYPVREPKDPPTLDELEQKVKGVFDRLRAKEPDGDGNRQPGGQPGP